MYNARLFVLVNGMPSNFFQSSKCLRHGDLLSPYSFVLAMEAPNYLLKKAREGDQLLRARVRGRRGEGVEVSHLLFVNDNTIFCEASQDHMVHLRSLFQWFEAIFR